MLSNVLNAETKLLHLQMCCSIMCQLCGFNDTNKKMRHVYQKYTVSYETIREKCNMSIVLIEPQKLCGLKFINACMN